MTRQPHLFDSATATIRSGRPGLFDSLPVVAHGITCDCGADLWETETGLACPNCRGKLIADPERFGAWFDDTEGD